MGVPTNFVSSVLVSFMSSVLRLFVVFVGVCMVKLPGLSVVSHEWSVNQPEGHFLAWTHTCLGYWKIDNGSKWNRSRELYFWNRLFAKQIVLFTSGKVRSSAKFFNYIIHFYCKIVIYNVKFVTFCSHLVNFSRNKNKGWNGVIAIILSLKKLHFSHILTIWQKMSINF